MLESLWENGLAGAGAVALLLGIWLSARGLGLLERPRYQIRSSYAEPSDFAGFSTMPHFILEMTNSGNVPVTFSDFELILPRRNIIRDDVFLAHAGAELFIDKQPSSRLGSQQMLWKIDYRTDKVRLEPRDSHTAFFDLEAFLPGFGNPEEPLPIAPVDFEPLLSFHDSFGNHFHCDDEGVHEGAYVHPELGNEPQGVRRREGRHLIVNRRLFRWLGWSIQRDSAS